MSTSLGTNSVTLDLYPIHSRTYISVHMPYELIDSRATKSLQYGILLVGIEIPSFLELKQWYVMFEANGLILN